MKITISIHHLPSGKYFQSNEQEVNEEELDGLKGFIGKIHEISYFKIKCEGKEIYFPRPVLQNCVCEINYS